MGEFDDGGSTVIWPITAYRSGCTDGYTHSHEGPLFRTYGEAEAYGKGRHGAYAIDPKPVQVIEDGAGGGWIVEGIVRFAETQEAMEAMRAAAIAKLTPAERRLLGVE